MATLSFGGDPSKGIKPSTYDTGTGQQVATAGGIITGSYNGQNIVTQNPTAPVPTPPTALQVSQARANDPNQIAAQAAADAHAKELAANGYPPAPGAVGATSNNSAANPTAQAQGNPQFDAQGMLVPGTGGLAATPTPGEQAFNAIKDSGAKAPQDAAAAGSAAKTAIDSFAPVADPVNAVQNALKNDPAYQTFKATADTVLSNPAKSETFSQHLDTLMKTYDVPGIDTKMMNDQKIINGTEDDIRHEVQAAGGFATDSQVLALASARNKTVIQDYNNLQQQKANALQTISQSMSAFGQDKQTAEAAVNQQLDIASKEATFMQQATTGVQEGYQHVIDTMGYGNFYKAVMHTSGTNGVSAAEQLLNLPPGALEAISQIPDPNVQMKQIELLKAQTELQQAQANLAASPLDLQAKQADIKAKQVALQQAQQNLQLNAAEEPLKLQQLKAQIASSNASAASSAASTAKTKAETDFMSSHGGMTPAEVQAQQTEIDKAQQSIQTDAADLISKLADPKNAITWQDAWSQLKTKYYPNDNSQEAVNTIDSLLQANNFRR